MADPSKAKAPKIEKRRIRAMLINPMEFMTFFTKGVVLKKRLQVMEGMPADGEIMGVAYDVYRNAIVVVIKSQEYDEIPANELPPTQFITFKVGVDNATKKKKK